MGSMAPWIVSPGGISSVSVIVNESDLNRTLELIEDFNNNNNNDKTTL